MIATNLTRHLNPVLMAMEPMAKALWLKSIPQGAATQCFVAAHPSVAETSGEYFADSNIKSSSAHGRDMDLAERLWARTEEILATL